MKNKIYIILLSLFNSCFFAQINITLPTWLTDQLSHDKYNLINTRNRESTVRELVKTGYIVGLKKEYKEREDELSRVNTDFSDMHDEFNRFINTDCNNFIDHKLPSFNIIGSPDFNNMIKKQKFRRKFTKYTQFLNKVYNTQNKMPEGKRVLFALQIFEEVLNSAAKTDRL